VRGSFAGIRVLQASRGQVGAATREWTLVEPVAGLLVPVGGKLTSARVEAARVVDRVLERLGQARPCLTAQRRLPWAPAHPWRSWLAEQCAIAERLGVPPLMALTLARRHGSRVVGIWQRIAHDPLQRRALDLRYPFCLAEVAHACEHEMAHTSDDLLRRRIPLGILALDRQQSLVRELACVAPPGP
jgi:glycerol-3-phosphate dehydrogenase